MTSLSKIELTYDFYNCDGDMSEVHLNPECGMIVKKFYIQKQKFWIYMRQCLCGRYEHVYEQDVDFKDRDDMSMDGVFFHDNKYCYNKYPMVYRKRSKWKSLYIISSRCGCDIDYLSYIR